MLEKYMFFHFLKVGFGDKVQDNLLVVHQNLTIIYQDMSR